MHSAGDEAGPAGLMACAEAGAVVAIEIFVEQDVVTPVGVLLKLRGAAVDGASSRAIFQENAMQPVIDFAGDFVESHLAAGTGGAFDFKGVAEICVVVEKSADDQAVDGRPDWAAPIGIATEHAGVRFRGLVRNAVIFVS